MIELPLFAKKSFYKRHEQFSGLQSLPFDWNTRAYSNTFTFIGKKSHIFEYRNYNFSSIIFHT